MKRVLFILGQLSDIDIEWLIEEGTKNSFSSGEHIINEGESIQNFSIILSGHCKIYNKNNSEFEITRLGSGEILGEMSLLDARAPSVSVMCLESTTTYSISLDKIRRRMEVDTGFAARFYYSISLFLSHRLRKTTSKLGYGLVQADADEINTNVLNEVAQAGARFGRILNKFSEV